MFTRVLVANRGEIAVRIIRACRELGIETVAVYSDADAAAAHVALADRAVHIGSSPPADSYLSIPRLLEAARATGAEAIHPGYGFLSESAAFAGACAEAGFVFVGPPAAVIARMGSKVAARRLMESHQVPVVPGETPADQSPAALASAAARVGYPVLLKPSAGGGGIGMRVVGGEDELAAAALSARREARGAFGDETLYVERLIARARHVEIQVLADAHGHVWHVFERECSLQRRHQKVIEESPSLAVSPPLRTRMGDAAVAAARAAGYRNAGTVEFLLDGEGDEARFYFLEMNTRLQVEHPVTEAVAGIDLVQAQLRIAAGDPLGFDPSRLIARGHAIECRVYAEDPARDFLPQAGRILRYREPQGPGIRVDSGVAEDTDVPVHYDPLLAKVVVHAESRAGAIARMRHALRDYVVLGIRTNIPYLIRILEHPEFERGACDTRFLDRETAAVVAALAEVAPSPAAGAAAAVAWEQSRAAAGQGAARDPWDAKGAGGLSRRAPDGAALVVDAGPAGSWRVTEEDGRVRRVHTAVAKDGIWTHVDGDVDLLVRGSDQPVARTSPGASDRELAAPMPATVLSIVAGPGATVAAGDVLLVLEAMKMELPVRAPRAGTVSAVHCREGELVQPGVALVELS